MMDKYAAIEAFVEMMEARHSYADSIACIDDYWHGVLEELDTIIGSAKFQALKSCLGDSANNTHTDKKTVIGNGKITIGLPDKEKKETLVEYATKIYGNINMATPTGIVQAISDYLEERDNV